MRSYRGHNGRAAFRLHNYAPVYKSYIKRKTGQPGRRGVGPDAPEPLVVEPLRAVPDDEFIPANPVAGSDIESEGPVRAYGPGGRLLVWKYIFIDRKSTRLNSSH